VLAVEGFKMAENAAIVDDSDDILELGFAGPLKKAAKRPSGADR
jgi:hypothetical protein